jgi:Xaa-Pro aminopeptidase
VSAAEPFPGPVLTFRERDRRWSGLRKLMRSRAIDAIVIGSFQGRERLESYLIDDFLDANVIFPLEGEPVLLAFSTGRLSRMLESQSRGIEPWVSDWRIGSGGAKAAAVLQEKGLAKGRIGIVGLGPTAPGEMEGLLPLGFWNSLSKGLPEAAFEDFTQAYTDFMLVKGEEEIALLRFGAQVAERVCGVMAETTRPGVSEATIYAEMMRETYRWGCDARYPFLSLQSGPANIGWGAPRWLLRAEPPRRVQRGDLVQAEIHTLYGGQEAQVQMSVALDPVDADNRRCEAVARQSYEAGLKAIRPGITFAEAVRAMEEPIRAAGCWSKTPLLHTLSFGSTGFTSVNREQLKATREAQVEGQAKPGIRRGELVLQAGMGLELEPNACLNTHRVNIGTGVLVTGTGCEALNDLPSRVYHVA